MFTSRFRSPQQHQSSTAAALQQSQGVTTSVIVKSATPRSAMQAASPIDSPEAEHSRFLVALAGDAQPLRDLELLQGLAQAAHRSVVTPLAACLHYLAGLLRGRVAEALLGRAGAGVATPNWATLLQLAHLAGHPPTS